VPGIMSKMAREMARQWRTPATPVILVATPLTVIRLLVVERVDAITERLELMRRPLRVKRGLMCLELHNGRSTGSSRKQVGDLAKAFERSTDPGFLHTNFEAEEADRTVKLRGSWRNFLELEHGSADRARVHGAHRAEGSTKGGILFSVALGAFLVLIERGETAKRGA
jgi:hypothetical protein